MVIVNWDAGLNDFNDHVLEEEEVAKVVKFTTGAALLKLLVTLLVMSVTVGVGKDEGEDKVEGVGIGVVEVKGLGLGDEEVAVTL